MISNINVNIPADAFYRMEQDYANIKECLKHYVQQNEELRQALSKCNPTNGFGSCWGCGESHSNIWSNKNNEYNGHKPNCEYLRLTATSK